LIGSAFFIFLITIMDCNAAQEPRSRKTTVQEGLQYGEILKKRLTERAENRILFDKYINIKIQFIQG
jgi:hypothetical protein